MTKEQVNFLHESANPGKWNQQQLINLCVEFEKLGNITKAEDLLKKASGLVGNPAVNISSSVDVACEEWLKEYDSLFGTEDKSTTEA